MRRYFILIGLLAVLCTGCAGKGIQSSGTVAEQTSSVEEPSTVTQEQDSKKEQTTSTEEPDSKKEQTTSTEEPGNKEEQTSSTQEAESTKTQSTEPESQQPESTGQESTEPQSTEPEAAYIFDKSKVQECREQQEEEAYELLQAALLGEVEFYYQGDWADGENQGYMNMSDFQRIVFEDKADLSCWKIVCVDLDGTDGIKECVLRCEDSERHYNVIFRYWRESVYVSEMPFRAMKFIYENGITEGSGSASSTYYDRMTFEYGEKAVPMLAAGWNMGAAPEGSRTEAWITLDGQLIEVPASVCSEWMEAENFPGEKAPEYEFTEENVKKYLAKPENTGAGGTETDSAKPEATGFDRSKVQEFCEQREKEAYELLQAALLGEGEFYYQGYWSDGENQGYMNMSDFQRIVFEDKADLSRWKIVCVDLDGRDGIKECVLRCEDSERHYNIIFHYWAGGVYASEAPYRDMTFIYENGIKEGSGSASSIYYDRIDFEYGTEAVKTQVAGWDTGYAPAGSRTEAWITVDGVLVEVPAKLCSAWMKSENFPGEEAAEYEFTEENVKKYLVK